MYELWIGSNKMPLIWYSCKQKRGEKEIRISIDRRKYVEHGVKRMRDDTPTGNISTKVQN